MADPVLVPALADVVIVGAGSAGCVLAERLSRDRERRVLLVEQGSGWWPDDDVRALRRLPIGSGAQFADHYPEAAGLSVIRGRGLGGSSIVNGGYFLRWHREDFDGWLSGWSIADVEAAYDELDGGAGPGGGTMSVSPFADDELDDICLAYENHWARELPVREPAQPWPIVGVNRVRSNRVGPLRMTAAEAYLRQAISRPNLTVLTASTVDALLTSGRDVTGVRIGSASVHCDEVILCAGTLGTASILASSTLDALVPEPELRIREHREMLVSYRAVLPRSAVAVLPTVIHTADGFEIRCYGDDFASLIGGMPATSQTIGVAAMDPAAGGSLRIVDDRLHVELETLDTVVAERMSAVVGSVIEMLYSADFAGLVDSGSVTVEPVVATSQHAWGTMPMGVRSDWLGGVYGTRGLRIVDGSILPSDGRSGPHATTMMMACRIGDQLILR